jgi:Ca2+-binding RTX toxin-like protein/subtilisin family serine protease
MNNNNNTNVGNDVRIEIAPQSQAIGAHALVDEPQYWNLQSGAAGSANFEAAWKYATGKGVLVGIIDEGVNYTHLDLADHYATDLDFDPRDTGSVDAFPDDQQRQHGTKVAGVIVGSHDNDIGTIGAAPDATITASYMRFGTAVDMAEIEQILAQMTGYDVANNSWGFTRAFSDNFREGYFAGFAEQLRVAANDGRDGLGTAIVVAAGNSKFVVDGVNAGDDSNFHNFSNSRYVIAVGAIDAQRQSAIFSSPGANLLVSAPGSGVVTTSGNAIGSDNWSYATGTSFAAPMVASAVALMLEINPRLGYRDIQEILAISATPSGSGDTVTNGAGNVNGGGLVFDRNMGFGTLDAEAAVKLAHHWTHQSTAANEEHLSAAFTLPASFDGLNQSFSVTINNPGTAGFSIDFVELTLEIDDVALKDLSIELVSANGTHALIAPNLTIVGSRTYLNFTFSSVVSWGENPYGTWTVNLDHASASDGFVVNAAALDIYGDSKGNDDTYYFTQAYQDLVAADAGRSSVADANGGTDTLNFAAAKGALLLDLGGLAASRLGNTLVDIDDSFENAIGASDNDRIAGSSTANVLNGSFGNDTLMGRDGDDTLIGDAGDDVLAGGLGTDRLSGGAGYDVADYSGAAAAIGIDLNAGINTGEATGDTFASIEQFWLGGHADRFVGAAGTTASYSVFAGAGDDYIAGGRRTDELDGGVGRDRMVGGAGNDVYVVDNALDRVLELAGGGIDTIISSINIALPSNVERLVLTGGRPVSVVANGLDNWITGNVGANVLNGGIGTDRLVGGRGNDTYQVDTSRDLVVEGLDQGTDKVRASANFTLTANIEILQLVGHAAKGIGNARSNLIQGNNDANQVDGMAGNDRIYGHAGNDVMKGNVGNDLVSAGNGNDWLFGGTGNDRLVGGAGKDVFVFDTARHKSLNIDRIADFSHANDTIQLDNEFFRALGRAGVLKADFFHAGRAAHDANDHIIYNKATGILFYDADGAGGQAQTVFAILTNHPGNVTFNDFVVI